MEPGLYIVMIVFVALLGAHLVNSVLFAADENAGRQHAQAEWQRVR